MPDTMRVLVTGAAGQIGYSLVHQIASGSVFGPEQSVTLVLLDIPPMKDALDGVAFELMDCALPLLAEVVPCVDEGAAFRDIDVGFLVGAMPRKAGMERKDLLSANVKIFKSQGQALQNAKPDCRVIIVGNPANTNAYICAKYAAPKISARNISAMTRLDHNRATAQVAAKCGVPISNVRNVIIWGNHSATQFPDVRHAEVLKNDQWVDAYGAIGDEAWIKGPFITCVQKRGAEIIAKRKLSSAMSAAKASCDHIRNWFLGTPQGSWVSMAVPSDGSYGIPEGIIHKLRDTYIQGLSIDDWSREKMDVTLKELQEEREEALKACEDA